MINNHGTVRPRATAPDPIDPDVRIGHVHLRTSDIDRVRAFYVDVLGFDVVGEVRGRSRFGTPGDMLLLSAGGYHHYLAFNTWLSAGGPPQPEGVAGLHHVAILYPSRRAFADAYRRLRDANWPIRESADHGLHESIYVLDPDGTDVELYYDRPPEAWPLDADGHLVPEFGPELDYEELLKELD
jgi:catechol 2,3-dioxygenase